MAKIPFSIDYRPQIESGEYKVETVDGRSARIICWDRIATEPYDNCNIVALVIGPKSKTESTYYYYQDGHLWNKANGEGDSPLDLYIITPEPELTYWQKFISGCLQKYGLLDCGAADRIAKECSAELLELARKELIEEQYTSDPRKTDLYKLGKEEALKDLPRWRKIGRGPNYSLDTEFLINGRYLEMTDYLNDVYEVALSDLEKLQKEDEK